ncbi:hypothetical protein ACTJKT_00790 [Pseudomonas sp. 22526]|jgi:hypothetical protein|uniref:Uncharacterized protein n=1 Tax=Pseudomonas chlororaphis TaxID=587753 RepID=A0AB34C5Z2_9PSED|nr:MULTISPECIES: hypothetical protein [Pseudomonas]AUG04947.1 hypothetical protein CXQ81_17460 [Pseudomonas sp. 09C 129]AVO59185.1 hypothetical protein C6Q18_14845 [Pseudomonas chlororaphis subsp. piscium]AZC31103.1 hypothetical protein C4K38_3143 [Pseudomonas chlororaphis subsp. piscium]AZD02359.1 hypothetical protein C4K27_3165 [Pseudomonas chlororaphis subsp. chlororaphis]KAA5841762.1 hypothetical protein F2A38_14560 [Pseudomonas chlororaphis]
MSAQENFVGGWTPYHELTPKDREVFKEALAGFVGVHYTPEKVSTQVVNGTNYRYLSKATVPGSSDSWQAVVEIYAPIKGKPHITQIHRI